MSILPGQWFGSFHQVGVFHSSATVNWILHLGQRLSSSQLHLACFGTHSHAFLHTCTSTSPAAGDIGFNVGSPQISGPTTHRSCYALGCMLPWLLQLPQGWGVHCEFLLWSHASPHSAGFASWCWSKPLQPASSHQTFQDQCFSPRLLHLSESWKSSPLSNCGNCGVPATSRSLSRSSGSPLSRSQLSALMQTSLQALGVAGNFTGHSFRIGAATTAAQCGIPDHLIKTLECWSSDAYQLYLRTPVDTILAVSGKLSWQVSDGYFFAMWDLHAWEGSSSFPRRTLPSHLLSGLGAKLREYFGLALRLTAGWRRSLPAMGVHFFGTLAPPSHKSPSLSVTSACWSENPFGFDLVVWISSNGGATLSRGWLPKVEAPGYPRHPTSILSDEGVKCS